MRKAVAYLRVSRQSQETDRQESNLLQYAKDNNIEILPEAIFKDKITGISSAIERQQFSKMLEYISTNKIKLVLTTEISRISRDKRQIINICEDFIRDKIQVIFKDNGELKLLDDNGKRNWIAGIVIDILSSFAQMEREMTIERNKDGMQYSISNGGSGYGLYKPYGFKKTEYLINKKIIKKLEIDKDEEKTVKLIFSKYLEGLGTKQIANYLNHQNIEPRSRKIFPADRQIKTRKGLMKPVRNIKWSDGTIYSILKNRLYIGERVLNDYEYTNPPDATGKRSKKDRKLINTNIYEIPAIIDKDTFEKVQRQLKENYNRSGNNTKYENILKDKIVCGICKHNYFMHKRANNKDCAYKCSSIRYNNNCGNYSVNINRLNNAVYFYLNGYVKFNNKENSEYIDKLKVSGQHLIMAKESIIKSIEQKNVDFENIVIANLPNKNFQHIITKVSNELQDDINKLNEQLKITINEIDENKELIKSLETIKFQDVVEDVKTFKKYASQVIDKIIVIKYQDDRLKAIYRNKQDKLIHCSLITINMTQHDFIISQRSNIMLMPLMESFYSKEKDSMTPFNMTYIKTEFPIKFTI